MFSFAQIEFEHPVIDSLEYILVWDQIENMQLHPTFLCFEVRAPDIVELFSLLVYRPGKHQAYLLCMYVIRKVARNTTIGLKSLFRSIYILLHNCFHEIFPEYFLKT